MDFPFLFFLRYIVERRNIMADIITETIELRKQLISAANIYKNNLAGHVYLYVYGEKYFEVAYMTACFKHLTGVQSPLSADSFYDNAKNATLAEPQIQIGTHSKLRNAKKKIICMHQLPQLTKGLVCVVKEMNTATLIYKLGITNLEFTVGLTENLDFDGNKVNDWLIPRTLRVKDKAIDVAKDAEFVDFIFSKKATESRYDTICYAASDATLPDVVKPLLTEKLLSTFTAQAETIQTV